MNAELTDLSCADRDNIPPPSTPRATGHSPADTTAADPLEEPPAILSVSYGFLVGLRKKINRHAFVTN